MPIFYTENGELFSWYRDDIINIYRPKISKVLISKFGRGPYDDKQITKILLFALDWYQEEFLKILQSETELAFYQTLFLLHEFSSKIHQEKLNRLYRDVFGDKEFAVYRRILKLCLEQACDLQLQYNIEGSKEYVKSKETVIDSLMYLGDHMFSYSNLLASQALIEDCIDLKFNDRGLFYFDYKHHYGFLITELSNSYPEHIAEAVIGDNEYSDFVDALYDCLGIDYGAAVDTIRKMHENFPGGKFTPEEPQYYPMNLSRLYEIPLEKTEVFFKGLTLSKENKMSLKDAVYRPHNINKYLYRPFLIWNVDGKDVALVGDKIFIESIHSLCTNAFGWKKYPIEWENDCFKAYIKTKVSFNDKILEDRAEKLLLDSKIVYDRNITSLKKWNKTNININNSSCGEIDFMFILSGKIYLADSKHQLARYDMNNFKNDASYFQGYNKTIARKLNFFKDKIKDVEEHFQVIQNDRSFCLHGYTLEGIFIVNTPTFIMYNNDYRIYTLKYFRELLESRFIDREYTVIIDEEDHQKFLTIKYPYFKKPTYKVFNFEEHEDL